MSVCCTRPQTIAGPEGTAVEDLLAAVLAKAALIVVEALVARLVQLAVSAAVARSTALARSAPAM